MSIFNNELVNQESLNHEIISYINQYRKLHQVDDLIHDDDISKISQQISIKLLKNKKLSDTDLYQLNNDYTIITNLNLKCRNNKLQNIKRAINSWYNEHKFYNINNYNKSSNFTGLIWKNSTKIGLGYSYVNGKCSVCILIYKKGNVLNQFDNNVFNKIN